MDITGLFSRPVRHVRRQPLYAFAVGATLALAIAAATASLAVVKRAFFDALPYQAPQELVAIQTVIAGAPSAVSAPVFEDLRTSNPPIADYAPIDPEGVTYSDGSSTETIPAALISPGFFSTLGVQPALGQPWTEGARSVAVVSWEFWQEKLNGVEDPLGRLITINNTPHSIVGVLPQGFVAPYFTTAAVWLPLDLQPLMEGAGRARRTLTLIARLAPGTSVRELNAHLAVLSDRLQRQHPEVHGRQTLSGAPLRDEMIGTAGPILMGVGGAAALLLLIVLANVAGLAAARAIGMQQQAAVRLALGATPRRIWFERFAENLVITLAGAVAGVWLGELMVTVIGAYQQQFMPRLALVEMDWAVASAGLVIAVVAALLAATVSSGARHLPAIELLRSSRSSAGSLQASLVRSGLVVVQVALALVLLVGAGLLVRTMNHLSSTSLGFAPDGLTVFSVNLPVPKYGTRESQIQYEREVLDRLRRIPGVKDATAGVGFPLGMATRASLSIFGRDEVGRDEIVYMSVAPGMIQTTGMRLIEGRDIAPTDTAASPPVVLINESMVRTYWPEGNAVGARVRIGPGTTTPWITVIGIVADIRQHGPTQPILPSSFGSTYQYSWPRRHFSVRSDRSSADLAADLRGVIRAVDPGVPLGPIQTVDDMIEIQTQRHRLVTLALAFFGVVSTVLCVFGLYGVVTLTSEMRRREYAIRVALGAQPGSVGWMVVRHSLIIGAAGVALGLAAASTATKILEGLLHGVRPLDAPTFAFAALVVLGLAAMAASLPARVASRVDPVDALKME